TTSPSPLIKVAWPTSTPGTSVIAFFGPGCPSNGTPRSRARSAAPIARHGTIAIASDIVRTSIILGGQRFDKSDGRSLNEALLRWARSLKLADNGGEGKKFKQRQ